MAVTLLETKDAFDNFLKESGDKLVVIDFYAEWCGPCKMIGPKIVKMAEEFKDKVLFGKVDVDENTETSEACNISAMPTFKLYKNGKEIDEIVGASEANLRGKIESNC